MRFKKFLEIFVIFVFAGVMLSACAELRDLAYDPYPSTVIVYRRYQPFYGWRYYSRPYIAPPRKAAPPPRYNYNSRRNSK